MRQTINFEVSDVLGYIPLFKVLRLFLWIIFKTWHPLLSFTGFYHIR